VKPSANLDYFQSGKNEDAGSVENLGAYYNSSETSGNKPGAWVCPFEAFG